MTFTFKFKPVMITGPILQKICPNLNGDRAFTVASVIDRLCPTYGIDTADKMHEFIARLAEECAEFTVFEENPNYKVEALIGNFGRHRISIQDARLYGREDNVQPANKQAIANIIYGGKWGKENLGNTQQGDGWLFRGSGPIQATGRGVTTAFCNFYNRKMGTSFTPEQMAELMRSNLEVGVHSACWIFAVYKQLIDEAVRDDIRAIVKKINGGYNGLDRTLVYLERAKRYIV